MVRVSEWKRRDFFALMGILENSSFLPQDKVSEFAAMSPQQLLRETQRAAGDANLTNWHDTLISAGKDLKQMLQVGYCFTYSLFDKSHIGIKDNQRGRRHLEADDRPKCRH